jgi:hypothetical protein
MDMDRQRRFLVVLTTLAVACAAVQALTGTSELVLYLTPLFLIAAVLLSGHYVAEDRIVAAWVAGRRLLDRRAVARPLQLCPLPLASLLARSPRTLRGPPRLLTV